MALGKVTAFAPLADGQARPPRVIFAPLGWGEVGLEAPEGFDFEKARNVLKKKLEEVRGHLARNIDRYENPGFRAKADAETVAEIAEKIEDLKAQQKLLEGQIAQLG
jgi:valyl-tRNA synthetase